MRLSMHEVLTAVVAAKTKAEKQEVLRKNDSVVLRGVLKANFDSSYKMDLPSGEPPYKKDIAIPIGISDTTLFQEWRRMYIWEIGNPNSPAIPKTKKESLFVNLLEGIHWTDAELICAMKDKKLQKNYKGLTEQLVRDTFADLLPKSKQPAEEAP